MHVRQTSNPLLKPCSWVWLLLLGLTLVTFSLGELGFDGRGTAAVVLGIAALKAQLVADHFMGLRAVAGFWRPLIFIYLVLVAVGIGLAF